MPLKQNELSWRQKPIQKFPKGTQVLPYFRKVQGYNTCATYRGKLQGLYDAKRLANYGEPIQLRKF